MNPVPILKIREVGRLIVRSVTPHVHVVVGLRVEVQPLHPVLHGVREVPPIGPCWHMLWYEAGLWLGSHVASPGRHNVSPPLPPLLEPVNTKWPSTNMFRESPPSGIANLSTSGRVRYARWSVPSVQWYLRGNPIDPQTHAACGA